MAVKSRSKIEAAHSDFQKELHKLRRFTAQNIISFSSGQLTQSQIDLLIEAAFFNTFRHYENFIREAFLLCCMEKVTKRPKVTSYLKAKSFEHSEKLIKSTSSFLDWAHPDKLVSRAELYLENGRPFKAIINTHRVALLSFKRLRNHIAHDSIESLSDYKKVLISYHSTLPINIPSVGSHLLLPSLTTPSQTLLDDFFDTVDTIATYLSH